MQYLVAKISQHKKKFYWVVFVLRNISFFCSMIQDLGIT